MASPFQDKEIAMMCVLLGIILVLTLFRKQLLQLLNMPVARYLDNENHEGFENMVGQAASVANMVSGPVPTEVKNFIRLAAFTRDGQTGMMNTLHLDTRKVVNPDTDVVVRESPLVTLMNSSSSGGDNDAAGKLDISKEDKALLLDVGKRKEGNAHLSDYYLDADAGLDMTLDMKFNAADVPANTDTLPATLVIREVSTGKTYQLDSPRVVYLPMRPNVVLLVSSRRSPEKEWDGRKYTVIQEFQVALYFAQPVSQLVTGTDAVVTDSFRQLINEHLSLAQSTLTYTLYVPEVLTMKQPLYSIQYYLRRGEVNRQPVAQVAHEEVKAITNQVLTERVPEIITPMYVLDKQIGDMERAIGTISDEYRSRQLAERQRQLQFYDTYA